MTVEIIKRDGTVVRFTAAKTRSPMPEPERAPEPRNYWGDMINYGHRYQPEP